ncbi:hypothetical protein A2V47_05050 [Candidatus Atribacteria bacterium RBG_19FT_COMBO_35_14]|uniref:RCK C-terminal domain-containing protein n=1 Tax=Candidatus Sediminicultor quintus TaxID=1797291 RepID=A0A1F5AAP8_9BACT|nr:MAG: hypothetical protein A2V47_05050 [Candidatus Atribacteria bacterium RBG_19FT_COMBO_35_14]
MIVISHYSIMITILVVTVILFILDVFRIDLIAILCMLTLSWTGILTPLEVISGFSSNAVIAMIAVMVMGYGISQTEIMERFSNWILKLAGHSKQKLILLVSLSVGLLSAFIQNVGAAALFLPIILRIAKKENYSPSELIMPMGFAAILGGNLTMVASGPLIILNDLLRDSGLKTLGLFQVTPIGLILLLIGILYFLFLGKFILPKGREEKKLPEQKLLIDTWHLPYQVYRYFIPQESSLIGRTPEIARIWDQYHLNILALSQEKEMIYAPWRETYFKAGQELALLGNKEDIQKFAQDFRLQLKEELEVLQDFENSEKAGFAEVIIPPRSDFIGKSIRLLAIRKNFNVEPIMVFSQGREVKSDFSDRKIRIGDILIFHGLWENLNRLKESNKVIFITSIKKEKGKKDRSWVALTCFLSGIGLSIAGFPLPISLFSGAIAMILTGVLTMEDFYSAIEWKVVFLIAGLIPLGIAMQKSGTAAFLAEKIFLVAPISHPLFILFSIAVLSTLFSLFMSNVVSTVVLVPLVINLSGLVQMDPRPLVLMAAICSANSFVLPTHQVNAILMTSGNYQNKDYLKAGGIMTLLFLLAVTIVFYLFYF